MEISFFMIFAAVCAYTVKGMCGFANTLVFTSILSFRNASIQITPVDLLMGIPANILIAIRERKAIRLELWGPLALMVIGGSIPGIFLLKFGDVTFLKQILGVAIVGIGMEMLFREYQMQKKQSSPVLLFLIGIISGVLCGLFGISALLAAYMGRMTQTTDAFRGNLSMVFLIDNFFRLIVYAGTGILTWQVVKNAVMLAPCMLLGLGIGILLSRIINESIMRKLVIITLIISGICLLITNLM